MMSKKIFVYLIIIFISFSGWMNGQTPELQIHYLGHSAFVLEFDNGIKVVTDYGKENAWLNWGWDSPISSINNLIPDVMTYSHTNHEDHYAPGRRPDGVEHILVNTDTLLIEGLSIKPIRVCEQEITNEDNSAFLFSYKGLKILHLGDAQAQIQNIDNEEVKAHIQNIIPDSLDLLFMTIDGPANITAQAVKFTDLVKPKRVIPMHYWTQQCKNNFCSGCENLNTAGGNYIVDKQTGAEYSLFVSDEQVGTKVITLTPEEYSTAGK